MSVQQLKSILGFIIPISIKKGIQFPLNSQQLFNFVSKLSASQLLDLFSQIKFIGFRKGIHLQPYFDYLTAQTSVQIQSLPVYKIISTNKQQKFSQFKNKYLSPFNLDTQFNLFNFMQDRLDQLLSQKYLQIDNLDISLQNKLNLLSKQVSKNNQKIKFMRNFIKQLDMFVPHQTFCQQLQSQIKQIEDKQILQLSSKMIATDQLLKPQYSEKKIQENIFSIFLNMGEHLIRNETNKQIWKQAYLKNKQKFQNIFLKIRELEEFLTQHNREGLQKMFELKSKKFLQLKDADIQLQKQHQSQLKKIYQFTYQKNNQQIVRIVPPIKLIPHELQNLQVSRHKQSEGLSSQEISDIIKEVIQLRKQSQRNQIIIKEFQKQMSMKMSKIQDNEEQKKKPFYLKQSFPLLKKESKQEDSGSISSLIESEKFNEYANVQKLVEQLNKKNKIIQAYKQKLNEFGIQADVTQGQINYSDEIEFLSNKLSSQNKILFELKDKIQWYQQKLNQQCQKKFISQTKNKQLNRSIRKLEEVIEDQKIQINSLLEQNKQIFDKIDANFKKIRNTNKQRSIKQTPQLIHQENNYLSQGVCLLYDQIEYYISKYYQLLSKNNLQEIKEKQMQRQQIIFLKEYDSLLHIAQKNNIIQAKDKQIKRLNQLVQNLQKRVHNLKDSIENNKPMQNVKEQLKNAQIQKSYKLNLKILENKNKKQQQKIRKLRYLNRLKISQMKEEIPIIQEKQEENQNEGEQQIQINLWKQKFKNQISKNQLFKKILQLNKYINQVQIPQIKTIRQYIDQITSICKNEMAQFFNEYQQKLFSSSFEGPLKPLEQYLEKLLSSISKCYLNQEHMKYLTELIEVVIKLNQQIKGKYKRLQDIQYIFHHHFQNVGEIFQQPQISQLIQNQRIQKSLQDQLKLQFKTDLQPEKHYIQQNLPSSRFKSRSIEDQYKTSNQQVGITTQKIDKIDFMIQTEKFKSQQQLEQFEKPKFIQSVMLEQQQQHLYPEDFNEDKKLFEEKSQKSIKKKSKQKWEEIQRKSSQNLKSQEIERKYKQLRKKEKRMTQSHVEWTQYKKKQ